jgi:chaperonin GroES
MEETDKIRPLTDRVLIEKIEPEEVSKGGIIIPKTVEDRALSWHAKVKAVGPSRVLKNGERAPVDVKDGDMVIIGSYMGVELRRSRVQQETLMIVKADDILGVVEDA